MKDGTGTALRMPPPGSGVAVPGSEVIFKPFVASDQRLGLALRRAARRRHAAAAENPQQTAPDLQQLLLEELA